MIDVATIKQWYDWGLWSTEMVYEAVPVLLSQLDAEKITKDKEG